MRAPDSSLPLPLQHRRVITKRRRREFRIAAVSWLQRRLAGILKLAIENHEPVGFPSHTAAPSTFPEKATGLGAGPLSSASTQKLTQPSQLAACQRPLRRAGRALRAPDGCWALRSSKLPEPEVAPLAASLSTPIGPSSSHQPLQSQSQPGAAVFARIGPSTCEND